MDHTHALGIDRPARTRFSTLMDAVDQIALTRVHRLAFILIVAGMLFDIFESNSLGLAGPNIIAHFDLSKQAFAWIGSATYAGLVIGGFLAGYLADRFGRRLAITLNLAVYSVGGLVCALAPNYWTLLVARFVGIGLGGELTVGIAYISEIMPTRLRSAAVALLNVGAGGIGNVLAPIYGVLVLVTFGPFFGGADTSWRWLFGLLITPVLLVVVMRRQLPESPRYLLSRGDLDGCNRSLDRLSNGAGVAVDPSPDEAWGPAHTGKTQPAEILGPALRRRTITAAGCYFVVVAQQMSLLILMPTFLVARGLTLPTSLGFTIVMQVGSLLGALCAALVTYRWSRRMVVATASLLGAANGIAFALFADSTFLVVLLSSIMQFFILLATTTLWSWAPELFPTRVRAFGVSTIKSVGGIGIVVMPPVVAAVFDQFGLGGVFTLLAAMFLAACGLALAGVETRGYQLEVLNERRETALDARPEALVVGLGIH